MIKITPIIQIMLIITLVGCKQEPLTEPPISIRPSSEKATLPKQSIVYITGGQGLASGVIIDSKDNTYFVLTARHVVGISPGPIEDPYKIVLHDNQKHTLNYDTDITKDKKRDLAIVTFKSDKKYPIAPLNSSVSVSQPVSIFGWKDCLGDPKSELTTGQIEQQLSNFNEMSKSDQEKSDNPKKDYDEGYTLKYTNPTIRGMSGTAVFNEQGEVVAIHGKPGEYRDNQYDYENCPTLDESYSLNWGIPIDIYLQSQLSNTIP